MPAGYSGTPLAKKLGIKAGSTVALLDAPGGWEIPELPSDVRVERGSFSASAFRGVDVAVVFCRSRADVEQLASPVSLLPASGSVWVAWPRKAAGHVSEVDENLLREVLLPAGVVDVKVAALGNDWSGLKFVWRKENRR